MPAPQVIEVDRHDDAALRGWLGVELAAVAHDRPRGLPRTWGTVSGWVRRPSPYLRRTLLAAVAGGEIVGAAELALTVQDNLHLAEASVHVLPAHRRRGVGTALLRELDRRRSEAGRTTVLGELSLDLDDEERAGLAFATAYGFASVHTEQHLMLRLPADTGRLHALRRPVEGYEVLTWRDRCPDELRADFCRMRTRMEQDVPVGEVDWDAPVFDEERLRTQEERTTPLYHRVVAAARRTSDGEMAGYSMLFLARDDHQAVQDDTLVMPDHRGHGLGMQLKLATHEVLVAEHPDRVALHTWTDPENTAMWKTNAAFGYQPVEVMHEVQRQDGAP